MKLYEEFEEYDSRFLVCEYCDGGTLEDFIFSKKRKVDLKECKRVIYEIAIGINFLHKNGLTHRDLKGDNVLIHQGKYKIADFGFANDESTMESVLGTPLYMAPEIIQNNGKKYCNKVDIWSLATIFYNLLTKDYFFYAERRMQLYNKIVSKKYDTPRKFRNWDESLKSLFMSCYQKTAEKRLSIQQFLDHPAFADVKEEYREVLDQINDDIKKNGTPD